MNFLALTCVILAVVLGTQTFLFAAEETQKLEAVTKSYNETVGMDLQTEQIDIAYAGTVIENGRSLTIYTVSPKQPKGFVGDFGALAHMSPMSAFIALDPESPGPIASAYSALPEGVRYAAFGSKSTLKNSGGYREVLEHAFVVPVADRELIQLLAKAILLNKRLGRQPISLQFEAEMSKGSVGRNLPWLDWHISNFRPLEHAGLLTISEASQRVARSQSKVPIGIRIEQMPIALLDDEGRVVVGTFNVGEIPIATMNRRNEWHERVVSRAQALWAAKAVSTPLTTPPFAVKIHAVNKLIAAWDLSDWPAKIKPPSKNLELLLRESTLFGRTSGEYRNPNHKWVVRLTDAKAKLNLQLVIQNNVRNLVGRAIPFGNRTDLGLFETSSGEFTDVVNLKLGFDAVKAQHGVSYPFMREVPRGVLMIHDYEVAPSGELSRLDASIDFEVSPWSDVHPRGKLSTRIIFSRAAGGSGPVSGSCAALF